MKNEIVIVCFGTPSLSGDALGPIVGSLLVEKYRTPHFVYGTEKMPLTARNMDEYLSFISEAHRDATVLAVDASLGDKNKIWRYTVRSDGVCPAAVGGRKKRVGDVGLLGIVGCKDNDHMSELLTANAQDVQKLADKMAFVINCALSCA